MATIAIVLKTKQKLSNNEYAVALRVTHERQSRFFVLNMLVTNQSLLWRCKIEDWKAAEAEDNGLGKFRRSYVNYKECNIILESRLIEAQKLLQKYEMEKTPFTFEQFESDLKHRERPVITSLQEYYSIQIKILDEQGRVGQFGLNYETQRVLKKFRPNALLSDVNIRFLESFEYWLRNE